MKLINMAIMLLVFTILVFFAWTGSGTDNLEFMIEDGGKQIEFTYTRCSSKDLCGHAHL